MPCPPAPVTAEGGDARQSLAPVGALSKMQGSGRPARSGSRAALAAEPKAQGVRPAIPREARLFSLSANSRLPYRR